MCRPHGATTAQGGLFVIFGWQRGAHLSNAPTDQSNPAEPKVAPPLPSRQRLLHYEVVRTGIGPHSIG